MDYLVDLNSQESFFLANNEIEDVQHAVISRAKFKHGISAAWPVYSVLYMNTNLNVFLIVT